MDTTEKTAKGFAIHCDKAGRIQKVLHDELEIFTDPSQDQSLLQIVDRASREKMLEFLLKVSTQGAAFDWEINIAVKDQIFTMHFVGGTLEEKLLVAGAKSSVDVLELYEAMMSISNEQINKLRSLLKEQSEAKNQPSQNKTMLYDELSYLNNELVTLQRELTKKNVELVNLNEQKNQFLGMAAHDLRNPLWVIMAYSELLLDDLKDNLDEQQTKCLNSIYKSSEFMLKLINDLLDVAKIESGKLSLELEPADITALAKDNVTRNNVLASKKQIEITLIQEENLPNLMIDRQKIDQVLNNLLSNAVKFSHPGSKIEVNLSKDEKEFIIAVKDQGQGIPTGELDKLFMPFKKTSVKSTGGEKSTGLGLSIVKKIVVGHKGKIWVESQPGQGSTFYFSLPLQTDAKP